MYVRWFGAEKWFVKLEQFLRGVLPDHNSALLAPRMTLNYNPEEEKSKYQVLLSPPDFFFEFLKILQVQIFENFAKSQNCGLRGLLPSLPSTPSLPGTACLSYLGQPVDSSYGINVSLDTPALVWNLYLQASAQATALRDNKKPFNSWF